MKDQYREEVKDWRRRYNKLRKALEEIRDKCGNVCHGPCDHEGCRDSNKAWEIADAALQEDT